MAIAAQQLLEALVADKKLTPKQAEELNTQSLSTGTSIDSSVAFISCIRRVTPDTILVGS